MAKSKKTKAARRLALCADYLRAADECAEGIKAAQLWLQRKGEAARQMLKRPNDYKSNHAAHFGVSRDSLEVAEWWHKNTAHMARIYRRNFDKMTIQLMYLEELIYVHVESAARVASDGKAKDERGKVFDQLQRKADRLKRAEIELHELSRRANDEWLEACAAYDESGKEPRYVARNMSADSLRLCAQNLETTARFFSMELTDEERAIDLHNAKLLRAFAKENKALRSAFAQVCTTVLTNAPRRSSLQYARFNRANALCAALHSRFVSPALRELSADDMRNDLADWLYEKVY